MRLHLVVNPGTTGKNTFTVTVEDYDTRQPVAASGVSLRFVPPRSDVGTSRLDLAPSSPSAPGVFEAAGTNLSLDGTWQITATVANGTRSVEVPLSLTVGSASPAP